MFESWLIFEFSQSASSDSQFAFRIALFHINAFRCAQFSNCRQRKAAAKIRRLAGVARSAAKLHKAASESP